MPGRPTSSTTTSGRHDSTRCTASMPLCATLTVWPSVCSSIARLSAASTLSSTTSTRTGNSAHRRPLRRRGATARLGARRTAGSRIANTLPLAERRRSRADTWPWCSSTIFLHQRQADAEPAARALERPVGLHERLEDARQQVGGNARAGVAHVDHHVAVGRLGPSGGWSRRRASTCWRCSAGWRSPAPAAPDRRAPSGAGSGRSHAAAPAAARR